MNPVSPVIPGLTLPETVFAKYQPQYRPLPAVNVNGTVISRWRLTWRERWQVLWTGNLWLCLMTCGQPLQPSLIETTPPYVLIPGLVDEQEAKETIFND